MHALILILYYILFYAFVKGVVVMEKILLKPCEVAQLLGIGRSLVYELINQKIIPSVRLGRCIRVPSESLKKWIKENETRKLENQPG